MQVISIEQRLADTGGRSSGFDYLRLFLCLCVLTVHAVGTSHGLAADAALLAGPLRGPIRMILPLFFALSGFLVAGSLLRSKTLGMFLGLRFIRIYPALTVEVLLSALIIGPLLTTLPLGEYFSSPVFWRYLVNVTGHISFALPGVFSQNPQPITVNTQLWTVPFELYCYMVLALAALFGARRHRVLVPVLALVLLAGHALLKWKGGQLPPMPGGPVSGSILVVCFLCGVAVYLYRERLPLAWPWSVAVGLAAWACVTVVPYGDYLVAPFAAYFAVALGLANPRRVRLIQGADFSYGIFLYGFVVQQALVALLPWARVWYLNAVLSLLLVSLFAAFSWHFVEQPALRLRSVLQALEARWLAWRADLGRRRQAVGVEVSSSLSAEG